MHKKSSREVSSVGWVWFPGEQPDVSSWCWTINPIPYFLGEPKIHLWLFTIMCERGGPDFWKPTRENCSLQQQQWWWWWLQTEQVTNFFWPGFGAGAAATKTYTGLKHTYVQLLTQLSNLKDSLRKAFPSLRKEGPAFKKKKKKRHTQTLAQSADNLQYL